MRNLPIRAFFLLAISVLLVSLSACGPKYPNCKTDEDCKDKKEVCVQEMCVQCRAASDCEDGFDCSKGACEKSPNYCEGADDCSGECVKHRCITQSGGDEVKLESEGCNLSNVFFDFDDDALSQSARDAIQANASCISKKGLLRLVLTGHTDPQGSEEYNLALGHRRAESVRRFLAGLGVSVEVTVTSQGEENAGEDSNAWDKERRVDIREQ